MMLPEIPRLGSQLWLKRSASSAAAGDARKRSSAIWREWTCWSAGRASNVAPSMAKPLNAVTMVPVAMGWVANTPRPLAFGAAGVDGPVSPTILCHPEVGQYRHIVGMIGRVTGEVAP